MPDDEKILGLFDEVELHPSETVSEIAQRIESAHGRTLERWSHLPPVTDDNLDEILESSHQDFLPPPYCEQMLEVMERRCKSTDPMFEIWRMLHPDEDVFASGMKKLMASHNYNDFTFRDLMVKKYAWAITFEPAVRLIAGYSPIVEIGAGTGYWANQLKLAGADVVAFDIEPVTQWVDVRRGGPKVAALYPNRALSLCWPPYLRPMAADCVTAYDGDTVLYIGEGDGGCTGDDEFHRLLDEHFTEDEWIPIPQWYGIHDVLRVYKRKRRFLLEKT